MSNLKPLIHHPEQACAEQHRSIERQKKAKVLVTGGGGQLGLTLKDALKTEVEIEAMFTTKADLDITDKKQLEKWFKTHNFDYCINCAAYTNVEQAEKTPAIAYKINAEGVKNLAEVCKQYNTILIHISTDYVFDGEKKEPYTIYDKPNPINEYGKSKLLGEQYIQQLLEQYFIVSTSWLYSKVYGKNFYKTVLEKAKKSEILYVTDEQTGCPTNTVNLSAYLIMLICSKNNTFGLSHFCDAEVMTWFDFAERILTENERKEISVVKCNYTTLAKRPAYSVLRKIIITVN